MKTTKMSLSNIHGKLSRTEMKKIMAGSGGGGCDYGHLSCYYNRGNQDPCVEVNMGTCSKDDGTWGCCSGR